MLNVAPDLLRLGLSTAVVVARGVKGSQAPPELAAYRRNAGRQLAAFWKNRSLSSHPALQEYERLHRLFGVTGEPAAPEKLLRYVRRHQDFTEAGAVVDCYNLVSAKTLLSIGAHDLAKLKTPVNLRQVEARDIFIPLGESAPRDCQGEYAYIDPDGQIICRMEVLQGDTTKVGPSSRDIVFFFQGNREIPDQDLLAGTWLLVELIERFCGGTAELTGFLAATAGSKT
ncbi:MAG TPA: phenylalanine--tRNA ligase beta subunit-related protein [Thermoanaerobaculia bacterium]|nr:phenylalanine--tRNA ligase beta subunit-related protein [Thermoanaerobaculia bacterium]